MITVYSTPTCVYCHALKEYLKGKKVDFKEVDLGNDPNAGDKLIDLSGQLGVPVTDIDGSIVVGFDREKIDLLLRDKKLI